MGGWNNGFGKVFHQVFFGRKRSGTALGYKADTVADTEYMRIDSHGGFVEQYALDDVGCFSAYTGKAGEFFKCIGHDTMKLFGEHTGHSCQMACLVVGIADAFDILVKGFQEWLQP